MNVFHNFQLMIFLNIYPAIFFCTWAVRLQYWTLDMLNEAEVIFLVMLSS